MLDYFLTRFQGLVHGVLGSNHGDTATGTEKPPEGRREETLRTRAKKRRRPISKRREIWVGCRRGVLGDRCALILPISSPAVRSSLLSGARRPLLPTLLGRQRGRRVSVGWGRFMSGFFFMIVWAVLRSFGVLCLRGRDWRG